MTKGLIVTGLVCLSLTAASSALAGPGSLPNYLLKQPKADRAPYALTGRSTRDEGWTPRAVWIGGSRAQRTVFERGERQR